MDSEQATPSLSQAQRLKKYSQEGHLTLDMMRVIMGEEKKSDAIGAALRELEAAGYIVRHKLRDRQGRISDTEYVIYEQPQPKNP